MSKKQHIEGLKAKLLLNKEANRTLFAINLQSVANKFKKSLLQKSQ